MFYVGPYAAQVNAAHSVSTYRLSLLLYRPNLNCKEAILEE